MRIGIDARLYNETGVGRYISSLLAALVKIDKKNEYIIFFKKDFKIDLKLNEKWKIVYINFSWHSFAEQLFFPWVIRKYKIDLMHFPYFSLPLFYRDKFIVTIHDLTIYDYPTGKASTRPKLIYFLKHLAYRIILKHAIMNSVKIITPSQTVAKKLITKFAVSPSKIKVTYEGGINGVFTQKLKIKKYRYFLYIGNVYPHKNIDNLIQAIKELNVQRTNIIKLVIVGKEDFFQKRLKQQITKLNLRNQIIFENDVDDNKLINLYKQAESLVFPSISEGFGLPAVEAMQQGCLVACSDLDIFREICGDYPFYFNPNDTVDIRNVLRQILLIDKQQKEKVIKKGIILSQRYSWTKLAEQTLSAYEEVSQ